MSLHNPDNEMKREPKRKRTNKTVLQSHFNNEEKSRNEIWSYPMCPPPTPIQLLFITGWFKIRKFPHVNHSYVIAPHGIIRSHGKQDRPTLLSEKLKLQTFQRRKFEHRIYICTIFSLSWGSTRITVKNKHSINTQWWQTKKGREFSHAAGDRQRMEEGNECSNQQSLRLDIQTQGGQFAPQRPAEAPDSEKPGAQDSRNGQGWSRLQTEHLAQPQMSCSATSISRTQADIYLSTRSKRFGGFMSRNLSSFSHHLLLYQEMVGAEGLEISFNSS